MVIENLRDVGYTYSSTGVDNFYFILYTYQSIMILFFKNAETQLTPYGSTNSQEKKLFRKGYRLITFKNYKVCLKCIIAKNVSLSNSAYNFLILAG